jgi:hypothetical protein
MAASMLARHSVVKRPHRPTSTSKTPTRFLVLARQNPVEIEGSSRAVVGGGISVPGWTGRIDPKEMSAGEKLGNAKLAKEGDALHVTTGPAVAYWNPDNTARGPYTVRATFKEAKYMNLNAHPHPYGVFIAGNDMGTDRQSYLYCGGHGQSDKPRTGPAHGVLTASGHGRAAASLAAAATRVTV